MFRLFFSESQCYNEHKFYIKEGDIVKDKYKPGQQVYFLICGRYVTKAIVVAASSCFVTIRFNKRAEACIIRLPFGRIFSTEAEAGKHIRPDLPPIRPTVREDNGEYVCTRRWDLWE